MFLSRQPLAKWFSEFVTSNPLQHSLPSFVFLDFIDATYDKLWCFCKNLTLANKTNFLAKNISFDKKVQSNKKKFQWHPQAVCLKIAGGLQKHNTFKVIFIEMSHFSQIIVARGTTSRFDLIANCVKKTKKNKQEMKIIFKICKTSYKKSFHLCTEKSVIKNNL